MPRERRIDAGESPAAPDTGSAMRMQRGAWAPSHHVITRANRAPSALPWMSRTIVHKLVTPRRRPAQFAQCLLVIEPGGGGSNRAGGDTEHFLYCLRGAVDVQLSATTRTIVPGGFAYLEPGAELAFTNSVSITAELLWVTREYTRMQGVAAATSATGSRAEVDEMDFAPGVHRRILTGADDPRHDFSMILMRFDPGADLGMVEIHDEEHGLWMTAGHGRYLLDRGEYLVGEDVFIYMAPYCPQSFVAGGDGAEYLLYKDAYRGPLGSATAAS